MISITYYYNVFKKDKTKKYILGRQYEYSGNSLRGWMADGTGVFVRTMDDFDVNQEETYGSTTDIYLTWKTEDHSLFPKCHFVEVVPATPWEVRTARKRLKKTYICF
jgi:anti-sigma regulatory factor (Ser/Thr protein kinase)